MKGFFANQGLGPEIAEIAGWAERRGLSFKRERDGQGFVIDGSVGNQPWRLEWGPSQRPYIEGQELRVRAEPGLPSDLLLLLMTRTLMQALEKQAYEEFTQGNQTQLGSATPEEMRWLVLFPKMSFAAWPGLRNRFGGVSNVAQEGSAWLDGPLGRELERASSKLLQATPPCVLMTSKGRAYLRVQAPVVDADGIAAALALFETACTEALRIAEARGGTRR